MTKMAAMLYMVKSLKNFSRTTEPIALKLGMSHLGSYFLIVYVNDDPGLTLTYFMARSNLVPKPFEWKKKLKKCLYGCYCAFDTIIQPYGILEAKVIWQPWLKVTSVVCQHFQRVLL